MAWHVVLLQACLPCTVNMCTTLTTSSHGDVSAAVFNASVGNLIGIFLTPLLLLGLMHVHSSVSFAEVLVKLVIKVLAPMALGQAIQYLPFEQIGVFVKVCTSSRRVYLCAVGSVDVSDVM